MHSCYLLTLCIYYYINITKPATTKHATTIHRQRKNDNTLNVTFKLSMQLLHMPRFTNFSHQWLAYTLCTHWSSASYICGKLNKSNISSFSITDLTVCLGPPDPCSTAVHMEPFSTSVYKVLTCIFATTTKICTCGRSSILHSISFAATTAASLLVNV